MNHEVECEFCGEDMRRLGHHNQLNCAATIVQELRDKIVRLTVDIKQAKDDAVTSERHVKEMERNCDIRIAEMQDKVDNADLLYRSADEGRNDFRKALVEAKETIKIMKGALQDEDEKQT